MLEHLKTQIQDLKKTLKTDILIESFKQNHYDNEKKVIIIDDVQLQNMLMFDELNMNEEEFSLYAVLHEYAHQLQYKKWGKEKTEKYYKEFYNNFPINTNEEEYKKIYPEKVADRFAKIYCKKLINMEV